jgi:phosphatidylglycerophosphate synthase
MTGAPLAPSGAPPGGFWALFGKSLKARSVEEPVDMYVHRPLAYIVARLSLPTPVTPNLITLASLSFTLGSAWAFFSSFPGHIRMAGVLVFIATVFDCADGQLARMRGTSSRLGRMLDGACDVTGLIVAISATTYIIWNRYADPPWLRLVTMTAIAVTCYTTSFHTSMYDHFKNVYLKMTVPGHSDSESYASARARYAVRSAEERTFIAELVWPIYFFYTKAMEDYVRWFDPNTAPSLSELPAFDEERARLYQRHAEPTMRAMRNWFGSGSLVFGIAVAAFFDVLEWYTLLRLTVLNVAFFGFVRPAQQRASRAAFREMGVTFPGKTLA